MTRRTCRRGDTTTEPAVLLRRNRIRYAVLTYPCCGCRTWVDVALLAYHWLVPDRPLKMRCGRRYDNRKLPGRVGCDWEWTITITPADDGDTPATFTWTA
ncbi:MULTISPECIES: hypothetical protein [unclassified Amycolatopsis]|uniref:hypothetical protein n=1 Tax=unclassified Amycolatopsis TaxID=2618356 RepID=UPI00106E89DC|nr:MULTISPECIES: hypothetical protein [unclassified Amycolatopsis]